MFQCFNVFRTGRAESAGVPGDGGQHVAARAARGREAARLAHPNAQRQRQRRRQHQRAQPLHSKGEEITNVLT